MENTYRIEMMSNTDFMNYMSGSNNYSVKTVDIKATSSVNALKIAMNEYPTMRINKDYIKTVEEIQNEEKEREMALKAIEEKSAKAKATRIANEKAKAEKLGLTVEEYKEKIKLDRKIKNAKNRIEELKKALEREEKILKNLMKGVDK
jgi:hypothetical protein